MPELPEVETIAQVLRQGRRDGKDGMISPPILGKRILKAHVLWERTLVSPAVPEFGTRISGQTIQDIGRRGKYLVFSLSEDSLLVHLRMSGDMVVEPAESSPAPHHRLMLDLSDGLRLSLSDSRKFGRVWLTADPARVLANLGPEPLAPEFTSQVFHEMLIRRHRQLKPLLIDQSFLAGIGNIYADEALHRAKLHPLRLAGELTFGEAGRLWSAIRQVLLEGIERSGASIDWVYRGGDFQNYFRVYQRAGKPCPVCGITIQRILVGQRGTHFCPQCQPPVE
jgi:formamidopyrimidine-DNA glycosylase